MYLADVPSCGVPVTVSWLVATTYRLLARGTEYQVDYLTFEYFKFHVTSKLFTCL
jgi:hypothetical protein